MKISIVVAADEHNAIGRAGDLLWRLPKDMQFFKQVTMGHHVVMGRKTYESIPPKFRPLSGRVNIVVTRQAGYQAPGCRVVATVEDAIKFAEANDEEELMIIGGGEIYRQLFDRTDRIYLTRVHHTFDEADTFFPAIVKAKWQITESAPQASDEQHPYAFDFLVLDKK